MTQNSIKNVIASLNAYCKMGHAQNKQQENVYKKETQKI